MKVLVMGSANTGSLSPFLLEQVQEIRNLGAHVDLFPIVGKGAFGYLANRAGLLNTIRENKYDLIHAHYGLSGLLAVLQNIAPVVVTYHGSDLLQFWANCLSSLSSVRSAYRIFVSKALHKRMIIRPKNNYSIIPCGVALDTIQPINKSFARAKLGISSKKKIVLFSSSFSREIKNYPLAKEAVDKLGDVELVELDGYSRDKVNLWLNACDAALMTSFREASPQFIKEAMACNRPIVSVDVGDVLDLFGEIDGCFICEYAVNDVASKLSQALSYGGPTKGRKRMMQYSGEIVASKIYNIYTQIAEGKISVPTQ